MSGPLLRWQPVTVSLQHIEQALATRQPRKQSFRRWFKRAAVALILREVDGSAEVLMIRRSRSRGDPWSGDMAFPGGLLERAERHGLDAARRETAEEIGLQLAPQSCIGRLSDLTVPLLPGRRGLVVSPYVFRLDSEPQLVANAEVAQILWVPLAFLQDPANRDRLIWGKRGIGIPMPCYRYQGRPIWGLSLRMLRELIALL